MLANEPSISPSDQLSSMNFTIDAWLVRVWLT